MKAEIITVGTEILIGSILNTNSKYISNKLVELGVEVIRQVSLNDNFSDIIDELKIATKKCDYIFLCGGLGPTKDDLTKEACAKFLNRETYIDLEEEKELIKNYKKININREVTKNNLKQVMLIEGSKKLKNYWGSALGEVIEDNGKKYFLFPGPPTEFEPMVDKYLPEIILNNDNILVKSINVVGLGESIVEDRLRKLNLEKDNLSINTFAKFTQTEVKLIAKGNNKKNLEDLIKEALEKLYVEFNGHIYSEDNESVEEVIVKRLLEKNLKISFAESITGGLLASSITDVAGASNILKGSFIAYSNEKKMEYLNVNKKTLDKFGAISEQTAYEMAKGLKKREKVDIAISTTGEAGPNSSETEVGNVYTCIYFSEDEYYINHYFITGDRNKIRNRTVSYVLSQLMYYLNKGEK